MKTIEFKSRDELEEKLIDFKVLFAYNSGKIENSNIEYYSTREVFENGKVKSFKGDLKTLNEIYNQKDCYNYLIDKILNKEKISLELIKKIHYELVKNTYDERRYLRKERPGEFKLNDYVVGINSVGANPEEVENLLTELIDEVNNYEGDDYLTVASYMHCKFENIHPFADGNGRVGRSLLNYYLLTKNIYPVVIYDEDRQLYYDCLNKFDTEENIESLKLFLEYEQDKTISKNKVSSLSLDDILDDQNELVR